MELLRLDVVKAIPLLEHGIAMSRGLGDNFHLPSGLYYLGVALCFAGELDAALVSLTELIHLKHAAGDKYGVAYTLLGFAAVAHRLGQAERSARTCGAVTAILKSTGIVMNPVIKEIYENELKEVRKQLTERQFNAAFAAGGEMTVDEAVRFALEVEAPDPGREPSPPAPLPRGEGS